jgi:DNA-binding NarL/FixJ family response regulator
MAPDLDGLISEGRAALAACDWTAARDAFERAATIDERADVADGLGQALYWLGAYPQALAQRERAYKLYHRDRDHRRAAMVAIRLAMWHGLVYGNATAVNGWVAHAQRNVERSGDCPELGWVELFQACVSGDPRERERHAGDAMAIGRRHRQPGLEYDALAYVGQARLELGAVDAGMRLIDEAVAAVSSGVVDDPWAAGEIWCTLFHACEIAIDVRRAEDWLAAVDAYVERTGELPITGICRMHYGGLLTAAGRWDDAERELRTSIAIYDTTYTGTRSGPVLRFAELRARQGRVEEARRLLDGLEDHEDAVLPRARVHLAAEESEVAEVLLERHLGRRDRGIVDAPALALLVDVLLARGRPDAARVVAARLDALAAATALDPVTGLAALARARVVVATGGDDAAGHFEQALEAFARARLLHDLARARLGYAELLAASRPVAARVEARAAFDEFNRCGAAADADAAARLLRSLGDHRRSAPRGTGRLTLRETEVLGLLTEGLSNGAIAERLCISPRTAEHHVGSILGKLGLRSRAEAAAYGVRHGG